MDDCDMPYSLTDDQNIENRLRVYILKRNFEMLSKNYCDVKQQLIITHNKEEFIKLIDDEIDFLDDYIFDFSRLFINFVSMAKAVVDVNRVLIKEWFGDTEFFEKYQEEVKLTFHNKPIVTFVQEIRNYSLHYLLPIANLKFPAIPEKLGELNQFEFVLSSRKLLKWNRWTLLARTFIQTKGDRIKIEDFIDEYYSLVSDFYKWLFRELNNG
jgi:hypothetical protein